MTKITAHFKGIGFMLLAMLVFVCVNTLAKDVVARYPLVQVAFFRVFFTLIPVIFLVAKAGGRKTLKTKHLIRHLIIGIVGAAAMVCLFGSLALLPLSEAITIHFSETLILTAMSAVVLKEVVGLHRWLAVILGFVGVLIMMRPTGDIFNIGAVYGLVFAAGDAFYMLNARILTKSENSSTVVFYFSVLVSLITGIFLPFYWQTPTILDATILAVMGIGGGIGQICVTQAYKYAPASVVAPMIYTALIWGILFGYIFWGEVPGLIPLIGAGLIVASGLYIIYRETRKQVPLTAAAPQGVANGSSD